MSMPTMIVANDVPRKLAERFRDDRECVAAKCRKVYVSPARQCPKFYEPDTTCVGVQHGRGCRKLADTAHCASLGCAARKARRALPGKKARRADEA